MRLFARVLLAAGVLLLAGNGLAGAAAPATTVSAGTAVNGESYWTVVAAPGAATTVHLHCEVANPTSRTETLAIEAVPGVQAPAGGDAYGLDTTGPASWVAGLPASVTVAPRTSRRLPFTVSVPATAGQGDHLAGVSVSTTPAAPPLSSGKDVAVVEHRVVIGLAIEVGKAVPAFQIVRASAPTEGRVVLTVSNTGTSWLHPKGTVSSSSRTWKASSGTLLPAATEYLVVPATGLAAGKHRISATLTSTGVTASWSTTVVVPGIPAKTPITPRGTVVRNPAAVTPVYWTILQFAAIPLATALIVVFLVFLLRRKPRTS